MSIQAVKLGAVIVKAQSGFASGAKDENGLAQIRMNNITTEGELDLSSIRRVPLNEVKNVGDFVLHEGDVLFNSTNSSNLVGKTALFREQDEPFVFSNHFLRLVASRERLDSSYLARWLTYQQQQGVFELLCTKWVNQAAVRRDDLLALKIPLPPLPEQRRIAAILDAADGLRAKRRAALGKLDALGRAVFLEMFGEVVGNTRGWPEARLADLADIVSGVTKGQRFNGKPTVFVPYMRVANVQDGQIDLTEVKTIEALESDVEKYRLQIGDILLTEGGDPDKLGRGAIWQGEIDNCIHQNHIFRVRLTSDRVIPEYVSALIGSQRGKRYFLKAAKQTTGIATINKSQLGGFPVLLPPIERQVEYRQIIQTLEHSRECYGVAMHRTEKLFGSLQQRAFRGEL